MQSRFTQIVWVTFGQELAPLHALRSLAGLVGVVAEARATAAREAGGSERREAEALKLLINELLRVAPTLLVSDDVWTREQFEAFAQLEATARLITTRDEALAAEYSGDGAEQMPPMGGRWRSPPDIILYIDIQTPCFAQVSRS